jgi:monoamine oxidase
MKIAMQFRRRFWDQPSSIGQRVFTDTALRRVYHFSIDQPGPRGIILSFTSGKDAEKLGRMSEQKRMHTAQLTCTDIWEQTPQYWEGGVTKYWNEDPWTRASYSIAGVGQKDFQEILSKSEGIFHFVGEHTSIHRASMNGAIESGIRASKEIKKG